MCILRELLQLSLQQIIAHIFRSLKKKKKKKKKTLIYSKGLFGYRLLLKTENTVVK